MLQFYIPVKITCNSESVTTCLWCEIPQCIVYRRLKFSHVDMWMMKMKINDDRLKTLCLSHIFHWLNGSFISFFLQVFTYYIISVPCLCVFAGVHLLLSDTCLTLHLAAPAYLAVPGQAGAAHGCVVTAPAAQTLAAGVFGARAAACTRRVSGGSAETGGVLQVD